MTPQDWQALVDKYGAAFWNSIAAPVWELAVRQVYADAVVSIVWAIALGAFALYAFPRSVSLWNWNAEENAKQTGDKKAYPWLYGRGESSAAYQVVAACAFVASLIASILALSFVTDAAQHFINPNWYALKNLLATVKK